jgi:hypothetical protein
MCFYVFLISSNYSITAIWGQNCFHGFCDSPKGQSAATAQPAARWFLQEAAACESTPEDADLFTFRLLTYQPVQCAEEVAIIAASEQAFQVHLVSFSPFD